MDVFQFKHDLRANLACCPSSVLLQTLESGVEDFNMATDHAQSTSMEWLGKDSPADKDTALHSPNTNGSEHNETISPLPRPQTKDSTTSSFQKTSSNLQNTRSFLGLHPVAPVEEEHDESEHSDLLWPRIRMSLKEPFAEFWGVFILVLFGDAGVAQVLLSTNQVSAPGGDGFGNYQSINWGWAIGVMLGIYVAGDSGAYLK